MIPVEFIDNDSNVKGFALPLIVMFAFAVPNVALPPIMTVP